MKVIIKLVMAFAGICPLFDREAASCKTFDTLY
jgi:hypothetical protein